MGQAGIIFNSDQQKETLAERRKMAEDTPKSG